MPVYCLGKGYESLAGERGHRRHAGTARNSLSTAEDEEAVHSNVVVAVVLRWNVVYDVVVIEGVSALGGAGLWRKYVEGRIGVVCRHPKRVEGSSKRELGSVRPEQFPCHLSPQYRRQCRRIRPGKRSSRQDECQGSDGYYDDTDAGSISGIGHLPTAPRWNPYLTHAVRAHR